MFRPTFIESSKKTFIFLIAYTVIFALFFSTISYTLPFVLAFGISIFTRPLNDFLRRKFKVTGAISAIISTLIVFTILATIFSLIFYKIINEIRLLLISLPDINTIVAYLEDLVIQLDKQYDILDFSNFGFNFIDRFSSQISSLVTSTVNITKFIMNRSIAFIIGLPLLMMIGFITFLSTYFFSKDMPNIERRLLSIFSSSGRFKVRGVFRESKCMLIGYVKSYAYVLSLTFVESLLGFTILGINYALMLSVLATLFDFLPVIGVGSVYMPMALYFYFAGNNFVAIGLLIMFVLVSIIRQIVEPKLMSTNLGVHPVLILGCIFIGLRAYGFLGVIYLLGLVVLYKVFRKVEII